MGVEYAIGKDSAQKAMVVPVNDAMNARSDAQPLNIGAQTTRKIVSQAALLNLVKQESVVEVMKGIIGNLNSDHALPIVDLAASQSRSLAAPASTRERR